MREKLALFSILILASCAPTPAVTSSSPVAVVATEAPTQPAAARPTASPTVRPAVTTAPTPTPEPTYTLVDGDWDWGKLVDHMGVTGDDPIGEILRWNPEVRNPYDLKVGQKLRLPRQAPAPSFPGYSRDFSAWKVIGTQTSKFAGSPDNRVWNIVTGANYLNNWFNDASHPAIPPRGTLSLNAIFGETSREKGYRPGFAIIVVDGRQVEVPSDGGGICQIPSTLFPAVLKAGLNVLSRQNHSYYPYWWWSYPEGFGWDATINTPDDPDFVVRNMYDYPVRLWATADLERATLRIDVLAPPELKPYGVTIEGPFLTSPGPVRATAGLNWITGAATTLVRQKVDVGGSVWIKEFASFYAPAPH